MKHLWRVLAAVAMVATLLLAAPATANAENAVYTCTDRIDRSGSAYGQFHCEGFVGVGPLVCDENQTVQGRLYANLVYNTGPLTPDDVYIWVHNRKTTIVFPGGEKVAFSGNLAIVHSDDGWVRIGKTKGVAGQNVSPVVYGEFSILDPYDGSNPAVVFNAVVKIKINRRCVNVQGPY